MSLSFLSEWVGGDEGRAATNREREEQLMSMCGNTVKEIRKDTKKAFDTDV